MALEKLVRDGVDFMSQLYYNRRLIYELTKREFKTKYAQNVFGLSWAIVEPLAMMAVLWLVFSYMRTGRPVGEAPFAIYLLTGLVAYDFFNKSINQATRSIKAYSFLVKQVNFRTAIIPLLKIFSEVMIHFIILGVVILILILNGFYPNIYWFQILYYLFAQVILLIGVSWATSSILLFFPDVSYIITITMRVLFFMTPIFWQIDTMPEKFATIFKINPLYYTVCGYRDSLLYEIPFWEHPETTIYFWGVTIFMLLAGVFVFKKMRPHFADVI